MAAEAVPVRPSSTAVVTLAPDPASTRAARRHVTAQCQEHAVPEGVVDDAVLVTSELVSNAVIHGRSSFTVCVAVGCSVLRVEVGDQNSRLPELQDEESGALDGRGLHVVDALADRWGVTVQPLGKLVWFELAVMPEAG